jgi:hypothetical protein
LTIDATNNALLTRGIVTKRIEMDDAIAITITGIETGQFGIGIVTRSRRLQVLVVVPYSAD